MMHLVQHAAHRGRVFKDTRPVHFIEAKALERRLLVLLAPDRRTDLRDDQGLLLSHVAHSRASFSRRPSRSLTFLPRRAATARGLVARPRASKVARIMLCGLEVPTDLATTSWTPSASKIARIGPPAMMPVPGLAARTMTLPAP